MFNYYLIKNSKRFLVLTINFLLLIFFTSCVVGPDFKKPETPEIKKYSPNSNEVDSNSKIYLEKNSQVLVGGQDISREWWKLFGSEPLSQLVDRALQTNPNIKAAKAALTVAQENVLAQYGNFYPNLSANINPQKQRASKNLSTVTPDNNKYLFNLYTRQLNVSYMPDIFGLNARTVEYLKAQESEAKFSYIAANLTLTANVIAAAIQEASLREQIDATMQIIKIDEEIVKLQNNNFSRGLINRVDLLSAETQLLQAKALLPTLNSQLEQQRHLLSVLTGNFPSEDITQKFNLASLKLPKELPLSIPSKVVAQRPDIRLAEESLRAASAQVGIARANRFPNITITANTGTIATQAFTGGAFWSLGANVSQTLFDGGTLLHREKAAEAAYIEVAETYKATVLNAFQDVADTLNILEQDSKTLSQITEAKNTAEISLQLTQNNFQIGNSSYLNVLNSDLQFQQTRINLAQAEANQFSDTAALFHSLGGGWWNNVEFADKI